MPSHPLGLIVNDSEKAKQLLEKEGIAVITERHFRGLENNLLRVKIGKPWENDLFIQAIGKIL